MASLKFSDYAKLATDQERSEASSAVCLDSAGKILRNACLTEKPEIPSTSQRGYQERIRDFEFFDRDRNTPANGCVRRAQTGENHEQNSMVGQREFGASNDGHEFGSLLG